MHTKGFPGFNAQARDGNAKARKEAGGFYREWEPGAFSREEAQAPKIRAGILAAKRHKNRKRLNAENVLNRSVAEATGVERGNGEAC